MTSWYKVTVPYAEQGRTLQDAFEALLISNGAPKDAALFGERSDDFNQYFYYFSPAAYGLAAELIKTYSGVECPQPSGDRMEFLAGDENGREGLLKRP